MSKLTGKQRDELRYILRDAEAVKNRLSQILLTPGLSDETKDRLKMAMTIIDERVESKLSQMIIYG